MRMTRCSWKISALLRQRRLHCFEALTGRPILNPHAAHVRMVAPFSICQPATQKLCFALNPQLHLSSLAKAGISPSIQRVLDAVVCPPSKATAIRLETHASITA